MCIILGVSVIVSTYYVWTVWDRYDLYVLRQLCIVVLIPATAQGQSYFIKELQKYQELIEIVLTGIVFYKFNQKSTWRAHTTAQANIPSRYVKESGKKILDIWIVFLDPLQILMTS